jgi:hypothetical protein
MSVCGQCKGTKKCTSCEGLLNRPCGCWPKGKCPRCKGTGIEPED